LIEERTNPHRAFSVTSRGRAFLDLVGTDLGQSSTVATTLR